MIVKIFKDRAVSKFKKSWLWINGTMLWGKMTGKNYACGRTKKDKHLCCCRQTNDKTVVFNEDKTKMYCKYCGHIKAMSNRPIDLNNLWG